MARHQHVPADRRDELRRLQRPLDALLSEPGDPDTAHLSVRALLALPSNRMQ